ncbi:amidohydrolase [Halolamina pelagica]|uniref:amidohydrolase n=1 Tax=Halolamina pelagica TaxID=699431 RepID=UPI0006CAA232|nr:amidohydrolase [Halolamina pelagica]
MSELLLSGGTVHTLDDDRTTAEAVLFRDGRVAAVGDAGTVAAAASDAEQVDLDGRTVLPGFNDAHTHVFSVGIGLLETDLSAADDREAAIDLLAANADSTPAGEWVLGFGYDESTWPAGERGYLTRAELDAVSEDHPIVAVRVDGHSATLNSRGLEAVDFSGVEHDVRKEHGEPTGRVVEDATGRVRAASYPDVPKAREALDAAIDRYHELGVTSIQTVAGLTRVRDHGSVQQEALFAHWRDDDLNLRTTFYVPQWQAQSLSDLEFASGFGDDWLRLGGLKTFSDGSIGSETAKTHREFDGGGFGEMVNDREQLREWFAHAARTNQQIATHAIGGEAIDIVIDEYERALEQYDDRVDPRLRVEHAELATDEAIERMADAGIVASMQPNFLQWNGDDGLYENRLGADVRQENNRYRDMLDAGVPLAFGSDKMPPGPLYGMGFAVGSPHESQRLTVDEALAAYTRGAAYAEFREDEKGVLEPGRFGDAVVLDADPYEVPDSIDGIGVELTIVDGTVVYDDR